jgi:ankyrin repeat protein
VLGGKLAVDSSRGMRDGALDELVTEIEKTGLAKIEDIFLSVIPALKKAGKLPSSPLGNTKVFSASAKEISVCLQAGHFHKAEPLILWLSHVVETSVRVFEAEGAEKWEEAYRAYELLFQTYKSIDGCQDYAERSQNAMRIFCQNCYITLCVFRNVVSGSALQNWKQRLDSLSATIPVRYLTSALEESCKQITDMNLASKEPATNKLSNGMHTLLIQAITIGHTETVVAILEQGEVDINAPHKDGRTVIHYASKHGHMSILYVLLSKTSEECINLLDGHGKSALDLAIEKNDRALVSLLITNGAKIKSRDKDGRTPLHRAVCSGNWNIVRMLIDQDADPHAKDEGGFTPLHLAVKDGHERIIGLLLDHGADINVNSSYCVIPLHFAVENGQKSMVWMLLSRKANIEAQDSDKRTPIYYAIKTVHKGIAQLLSVEAQIPIPQIFINGLRYIMLYKTETKA